jgi:hypothetical protein
MRMIGRRYRCALLVLLFGAAPRVALSQDSVRVATTRSVETDVLAKSLALESQGKLVQAAQVLIDAFGPRPAAYEPSVRLAALLFQLRRSQESVALYRVARVMPDAQPEATLGLGLALTLQGYDQMTRGALGRARTDFLEALIIDDTNVEARKGLTVLGGARGTGVDVLASTINMTNVTSTFQLFAVQVPVRVNENVALRFAAQQLNAPDFGTGNTAITATTQLYAAVARDVGISTLEGMGILSNASGSTTIGGAASVRAGGTVGAMLSLAVLGLRSGTNLQATPAVFVRPAHNVVMSVGARITHDTAGTIVSPVAAVGIRGAVASFDVTAHLGSERSALSMVQPAFQPYLGTSSRGVTGLLSVRVARQLRLMAQVQLERSNWLGTFRNVGVGFRVVPR